MSELEIHYADGWAALYVDGALERVGDSYLAEERAFELLGVKIVQDDAFMLGQGQASGVAQTTADVESYAEQRAGDQVEALRLRQRAAELLATAEALTNPRGAK